VINVYAKTCHGNQKYTLIVFSKSKITLAAELTAQ